MDETHGGSTPMSTILMYYYCHDALIKERQAKT